MILSAYTFFWFAWFLWIQSIGRFNLSLPSALVFDFAVIVLWVKFFKPRVNDFGDFTKAVKRAFMNLPYLMRLLVLAALGSIAFTALFQIPLDWDGLDYHLPPIVESWKSGFWHRTDYPYFCAKNYPKTHSSIALWWLLHFGKILGLRLILILPLLHWIAGLWASFKLIGQNKWVLLFWIAFPLATREAPTWLADLAGLSTFLCFLVFAREKKWGYAAVSLALHGAMKYSNLPTAVMALVAVNVFEIITEKKIIPIKKNFLMAFVFLAVAAIQPIQNMKAEGRPFGPLKCVIAGRDWCNGTLDPNKLVVAPIIPAYEESDSWPKKMLTGWTPSQIVPGSDVDRGGFGLAWIPAILAAAYLAFIRRGILRNLWAANRYAVFAVAAVFVADLSVSAHWYCRFHLLQGWALGMFAALAMNRMAGDPLYFNETGRKILVKSVAALLALQILWLVPQRTWFLGAHSARDVITVFENIDAIISRGFPEHFTNPADERMFKLFKNENKKVVICGERVRPALPAFGSKLNNNVSWHQPLSGTLTEPWPLPACPKIEMPPTETVEGTSYWIL